MPGGAALTGPTDSVGRISERAIRHDVVPDEGKKCRVAWNYGLLKPSCKALTRSMVDFWK
ncbi:hypothetical protein CBI65_19360 [Salmonella enterica]|nr:hypothetical protein CBI65_19360 [Salmonella enterica]